LRPRRSILASSTKEAPVAKVINCACGETIRGETENEVLDNAEEHVRETHADMADQFPRETLAGMVEDD
jgi:predicted small metal-binding protein